MSARDLDSSSRIRALALVAAIALLSNWTAIFAGFMWDDEHLIVDNRAIRSVDGIAKAFGQQLFHGSAMSTSHYRPLHIVLYTIEYRLFELRPWAWHGVSLAMYAALCCLILVMLMRSGMSARASLFAALIFAAHPMHAEEVGMLMGQGSLLASILAAGALLLILNEPAEGRLIKDVGAALLFLLALLAKPSTMFLPLAAPCLIIAAQSGRGAQAWRRAGWIAALLATASTVYIVMSEALMAEAANTAGALQSGTGPIGRGLMAGPQIAIWYAAKLALPIGLSVDYSWRPVMDIASSRALLSLAIAGIGTAMAIWGLLRGRAWAAWLAWFFASLIPVSQILELPEAVTDRYAFLPSLGLIVLAGIALDRIATRSGRRVAAAIVGMICAALMVLSVSRNMDFRDTETLWRSTLARNPRSVHAQYNLGLYFLEKGDSDTAGRFIRSADRLDPDNPVILAALGDILFRRGDIVSALEVLERAVAIDAATPGALRNLAVVEFNLGFHEPALHHISQARLLFPEDEEIADYWRRMSAIQEQKTKSED